MTKAFGREVGILHITASIGKESHGLGQVAVNLVKAQNALGIDAEIWCINRVDQVEWAIEATSLARDRITAFKGLGRPQLGLSLGMLVSAYCKNTHFDIVHQHGIWTPCSIVSNRLRRAAKASVVVAPHGSLQTWALARSRWKKGLASLAYERQNLGHAACLHATADAEVADFRNYGLLNPIALISNGISDTWVQSVGVASRFRTRFEVAPDRRILLFLSRITPKKGLPMLLRTIDRLRNEFAGWLLLIGGTDEFGHLQEVQSLVTELELQSMVKFVGPLYDQDKRDAFAATDAFVLPSHSEGAPMVVLDCLATGVPVLTTEATPWQSLNDVNCGWWVEASIDGLAKALSSMLSLSREGLQQMGQRGLELVRSQYTWEMQAQRTLEVYRWLLNRGPRPTFVLTT